MMDREGAVLRLQSICRGLLSRRHAGTMHINVWCRNFNAHRIQQWWRLVVAIRRVRELKQRRQLQRFNAKEARSQKRVEALKEHIAWHGAPCHNAAVAIQQWFRGVRCGTIHKRRRSTFAELVAMAAAERDTILALDENAKLAAAVA